MKQLLLNIILISISIIIIIILYKKYYLKLIDNFTTTPTTKPLTLNKIKEILFDEYDILYVKNEHNDWYKMPLNNLNSPTKLIKKSDNNNSHNDDIIKKLNTLLLYKYIYNLKKTKIFWIPSKKVTVNTYPKLSGWRYFDDKELNNIIKIYGTNKLLYALDNKGNLHIKWMDDITSCPDNYKYDSENKICKLNPNSYNINDNCNILKTNDNKDVICPPNYTLTKDINECQLKHNRVDKYNPSKYKLSNGEKWPNNTWNRNTKGVKTNGNYIYWTSKKWTTNPLPYEEKYCAPTSNCKSDNSVMRTKTYSNCKIEPKTIKNINGKTKIKKISHGNNSNYIWIITDENKLYRSLENRRPIDNLYEIKPPKIPLSLTTNGRCGPKYNYQQCTDINYCSKFNWCGKTNNHKNNSQNYYNGGETNSFKYEDLPNIKIDKITENNKYAIAIDENGYLFKYNIINSGKGWSYFNTKDNKWYNLTKIEKKREKEIKDTIEQRLKDKKEADAAEIGIKTCNKIKKEDGFEWERRKSNVWVPKKLIKSGNIKSILTNENKENKEIELSQSWGDVVRRPIGLARQCVKGNYYYNYKGKDKDESNLKNKNLCVESCEVKNDDDEKESIKTIYNCNPRGKCNLSNIDLYWSTKNNILNNPSQITNKPLDNISGNCNNNKLNTQVIESFSTEGNNKELEEETQYILDDSSKYCVLDDDKDNNKDDKEGNSIHNIRYKLTDSCYSFDTDANEACSYEGDNYKFIDDKYNDSKYNELKSEKSTSEYAKELLKQKYISYDGCEADKLKFRCKKNLNTFVENEKYYNLKKWDLVGLCRKIHDYSEYPEIPGELTKEQHKKKLQKEDLLRCSKNLKQTEKEFIGKNRTPENYKKFEKTLRCISDSENNKHIMDCYNRYGIMLPIWKYKNENNEDVYRLSNPPSVMKEDLKSCLSQQYKLNSWDEKKLCKKLWDLSNDKNNLQKNFDLKLCEKDLKKKQEKIKNFTTSNQTLAACKEKKEKDICTYNNSNSDNINGICEYKNNNLICQNKNDKVNYLTLEHAFRKVERAKDQKDILNCNKELPGILPISTWKVNNIEKYRLHSYFKDENGRYGDFDIPKKDALNNLTKKFFSNYDKISGDIKKKNIKEDEKVDEKEEEPKKIILKDTYTLKNDNKCLYNFQFPDFSFFNIRKPKKLKMKNYLKMGEGYPVCVGKSKEALWKLKPAKDDHVIIENNQNKGCLIPKNLEGDGEVENLSDTYFCSGDSNRALWKLNKKTDGKYLIKNKIGNKCLIYKPFDSTSYGTNKYPCKATIYGKFINKEYNNVKSVKIDDLYIFGVYEYELYKMVAVNNKGEFKERRWVNKKKKISSRLNKTFWDNIPTNQRSTDTGYNIKNIEFCSNNIFGKILFTSSKCDDKYATWEIEDPSKIIYDSKDKLETGFYVIKNIKNKGCLTHANRGKDKGPIQDWPGVFCEGGSEQAIWKIKQIKDEDNDEIYYTIQNKKNTGCLTQQNDKNSEVYDLPKNPYCTGDKEDVKKVYKFDHLSRPQLVESKKKKDIKLLDKIPEESLWKINLQNYGYYTIQNKKYKGCLTHINRGLGKGPIKNLQDKKYCNGDDSKSLWEITKLDIEEVEEV